MGRQGSTAERLPKELESVGLTAHPVPGQQILWMVVREVELALADVREKRGSLPVLGAWNVNKLPDLPCLPRSE